MTKGYTLSYFLNLLGNSRARQLTNKDSVYSFVSPRFGFNSVRAVVLDTWLGGKTTQIVNGTGRFSNYGSTPRARLLKALRNRKVTGAV
jgi:hypothetical protein